MAINNVILCLFFFGEYYYLNKNQFVNVIMTQYYNVPYYLIFTLGQK